MALVVVVGGINQDVVVRAPHRPRGGETVVGSGPVWGAGGKGANMAVAAAGAGARVVLCGAVGDDASGRAQLDALVQAGVDVSAVRVSASDPTGVALIVVTPDGENAIVVGAGANHTLAADDVRATPAEAGVLLVQSEIGLDASEAAVDVARERRTRLVLSLAPVVPLTPAALAGADPLVVNEEEAADVLRQLGREVPSEHAELARAVLGAAGCPSLVLTLGGEGAVVADAEALTHLPSPVVDVVDTTGAGDVLAGVLAASLAEGAPLYDAAVLACAAAADSVRYDGARGRPRGS